MQGHFQLQGTTLKLDQLAEDVVASTVTVAIAQLALNLPDPLVDFFQLLVEFSGFFVLAVAQPVDLAFDGFRLFEQFGSLADRGPIVFVALTAPAFFTFATFASFSLFTFFCPLAFNSFSPFGAFPFAVLGVFREEGAGSRLTAGQRHKACHYGRGGQRTAP